MVAARAGKAARLSKVQERELGPTKEEGEEAR